MNLNNVKDFMGDSTDWVNNILLTDRDAYIDLLDSIYYDTTRAFIKSKWRLPRVDELCCNLKLYISVLGALARFCFLLRLNRYFLYSSVCFV